MTLYNSSSCNNRVITNYSISQDNTIGTNPNILAYINIATNKFFTCFKIITLKHVVMIKVRNIRTMDCSIAYNYIVACNYHAIVIKGSVTTNG